MNPTQSSHIQTMSILAQLAEADAIPPEQLDKLTTALGGLGALTIKYPQAALKLNGTIANLLKALLTHPDITSDENAMLYTECCLNWYGVRNASRLN